MLEGLLAAAQSFFGLLDLKTYFVLSALTNRQKEALNTITKAMGTSFADDKDSKKHKKITGYITSIDRSAN